MAPPTARACPLPLPHRQGGAPAKKAVKRPVATGATAGSSTLASLIKALLPILIVLAAVYYVQLQVRRTDWWLLQCAVRLLDGVACSSRHVPPAAWVQCAWAAAA